MNWFVAIIIAVTLWLNLIYFPDLDQVSRAEARMYLNTRTDFETYELHDDPVRCVYNKYTETWGIQFTGTNTDGSTFEAVVCPMSTPGWREIPNQPDDPLDVKPNYEQDWWFHEYYHVMRLQN